MKRSFLDVVPCSDEILKSNSRFVSCKYLVISVDVQSIVRTEIFPSVLRRFCNIFSTDISDSIMTSVCYLESRYFHVIKMLAITVDRIFGLIIPTKKCRKGGRLYR